MANILSKFEQLPLLDRVFDVSIVLKGIDGLLELLGGLLLLVIPLSSIIKFVTFLAQSELAEDPKDFIATHMLSYVHTLSISTSLFIVAYLFTHGVVKVVLVVALLKQKLWAYPWMIVFLVIFIAYQVYQLVLHLSVGLLLLTLFDIFIVYLTVLEYKKHKAKAVISLAT